MPVFKTRTFDRSMKRSGMTDRVLWAAVLKMAGDRANIDKDELRALQEVAKELLGLDHRQLDIALQASEIVEVGDGDENA